MDWTLVRRVRQSPRLRPVGVAAYRAVDRLMPAPDGPRVVANSMPKSGTHLLTSLLDQLEGMRFAGHVVMFTEMSQGVADERLAELDERLAKLRSSRYIGAHLICDPRVEERIEASGARLVTILRDPRALVVSAAHYLVDAEWMPHRDRLLELFPDRGRLHESVMEAVVYGRGEPGEEFYFPQLRQQFAAYARWLDSSAGLTVRFEDLVGARGGGSDETQAEVLGGILEHLGYAVAGESRAQLARRMFSERSITFRSGRVDSWRDELPGSLARAIEEHCADEMARLGYL